MLGTNAQIELRSETLEFIEKRKHGGCVSVKNTILTSTVLVDGSYLADEQPPDDFHITEADDLEDETFKSSHATKVIINKIFVNGKFWLLFN